MKEGFLGQRPSKSAEASRRKEMAAIAATTARERMLTALDLGEWLKDLALRRAHGKTE
jgi:hypothetical protein